VKKIELGICVLLLSALACSNVPLIGANATPTFTEIPTATSTLTPEPTLTPTSTIAPTPTLFMTATPDLPIVTVNKQAHCRYGPAVAYLHAADLFAGDRGYARYRALYSGWIYVQFDKIDYSCWVAPSVVDVTGDISTLEKIEPNLLSIGSNRYGPPTNVQAFRNGSRVTVTWDRVEMTKDDDRGYFIEAFVCQDDAYLWWTEAFPKQDDTTFEVKDEEGCNGPSYGKLYTVEKHGFSYPVDIPWPAP